MDDNGDIAKVVPKGCGNSLGQVIRNGPADAPRLKTANDGSHAALKELAAAKCGEVIPFAETPSPEEEPEPQFRTINLECPHSGTEDIYARMALMTRRQGPESK
jgi:hypothetical protein